MKNKICNIVLIILATLLICILFIIIKTNNENKKNMQALEEVICDFDNQLNNLNNEDEKISNIQLEYKGYNVIGIINIPKLDIKYPILEVTNDETMKVSVTKFWGNNVNDVGNFTIAGHNNFNGTFFSDINKLNIGDKIEMTDLSGEKIEYEILKKYVIDPNDLDCIKSMDENKREITLLTCINARRNRLVIKASEIINF